MDQSETYAKITTGGLIVTHLNTVQSSGLGALMDYQNALDLTAHWLSNHPHLKPDPNHCKLPDYLNCSMCGGVRAFEIMAHVRFGPDHWVNETPVMYCPDCNRFCLTAVRHAECVARVSEIEGLLPTAIDARLWSINPTFLNIEPTTRCNFSCWYCVGRHMVQADIEVDNFERMLDHFPAVQAIALVGEGEPLLHKGFFDMAEMARRRGIRVLMLTNGSAFSESVVRKLCESEIAYVSISIDSFDSATFAKSRIDGDLNRIWEGISRLRRYRDEQGYEYPKIGLKGTLFGHTEDQIPAIVEEAKRRGVEIFESFQPLNPKISYVRIYPKEKLTELNQLTRVSERIATDSIAARHRLQDVETFCATENIPASNSGRPNRLRPGCDEEWLYSLLSGHITPCCQVKNIIDPAWNLFERSVADILGLPSYENTRFNLWNGLFPDYCNGCWKTQPRI